MAHQEEPMDVDSSMCDFDNKENASQHGNVLSTPCTDKGNEELDVAESNMKVRQSTTPDSSSMSKSFTANVDNRTYNSSENNFENVDIMTQSLQSTLTTNETRLPKTLPLQALADPYCVSTRNVLRPLDSTVILDNVKLTISTPNEHDDIESYPSSSSSIVHTPEATTPTKEITKDAGSPIMGVFKSVLSMFRSSQSPIPPEDDNAVKAEALSPPIVSSQTGDKPQAVSVSTPLGAPKTVDMLTKHTSPGKDNIVFNEELENELLWSNESTIIFDDEKVPLHKLLNFRNVTPQSKCKSKPEVAPKPDNFIDKSVEYMDISYNDSAMDQPLNSTQDKLNKNDISVESDSEFVDCETTLNKTETIFSAETSLEYVDLNLDSTQDIVNKLTVLSDDTADISTNTLEVSTNTVDLSNVSTKTAIAENNNSTFEVKPESQSMNEEKLLIDGAVREKNQFPKIDDIVFDDAIKQNIEEVAVNPAHVSLSLGDSNNDIYPIISYPVKHNVEASKQNPIDENFFEHAPKLEASNDLVSLSITKDKNVINSIATIPLIADPRILLFDIPSEESVDTIEVRNLNVESSPADVPLPDDDDLASLPPSSNSVADHNSTLLNEVKDNEKNINLPAISSPPREIEQENEVTVNSDINEDKANTLQQPIIEINTTLNKQASETNELTNALQVVMQTGIAPIAQNLMPTEKEIAELELELQTRIDILHDIQQINDVTSGLKKENRKFEPNNQEATVQDVFVDPNINIVETVKCDVTPKPEPTITNETSILEAKPKPLSIDIPLSPKPENYVAPVSDLVIKGSVQETLPDNTINSSHELQERNIQEQVIKTIPANIVAKLRISLGNRESKEEKVDAAEYELPVSAKELQLNLSSDHQNHNQKDIDGLDNLVTQHAANKSEEAQVTKSDESILPTDGNNIEIRKVQNENRELKSNVDLESVIKVGTNNNTSTNTATDVCIVNKTIRESKEKLVQLDISTAHQDKEEKINDSIDNLEAQKDTTNNTIPDQLPKSDESMFLNNSDTSEIKKVHNENKELKSKLDLELVMDTDTSDNITTTNTMTDDPTEVNKTVINEKTQLFSRNTSNSSDKKELTDTEIVVSENNSPFVSLTAEIEDHGTQVLTENKSMTTVETIPALETEIEPKQVLGENTEEFLLINDKENLFSSKCRNLATPPTSPAIVSKGYIFNFDEIEDPFATKTKIRSSPSPGASPNQTVSHINPDDTLPVTDLPEMNLCRKLQPEKRKPIKSNKKLNSASAPFPAVAKNKKVDEKCNAQKDKHLPNLNQHVQHATNAVTNEELVKGLPEVDDPDFNPFATKTKIRESPPPCPDRPVNNLSVSPTQTAIEQSIETITENEDHDFNPFTTNTKIRESPPPIMDGVVNNINSTPTSLCKDLLTLNIDSKRPSILADTKENEKHALDDSNPAINVTCLSKTSTMRASSSVNTEDEDTIEGPFLDETDFKEDVKMSEFDSENVGMFEFGNLLPANEDNADRDLFIDAEAFEFLINQNTKGFVGDSGKESLFLKFDPLFANRVSNIGISPALKRQETKKVRKPPQPKSICVVTQEATLNTTAQLDVKSDKIRPPNATIIESVQDSTSVSTTQQDSTSIPESLAETSKLVLTDDLDPNAISEESLTNLDVTVTKPVMIVNPAVHTSAKPRDRETTPNRRSLTATAIDVIDRLLSSSACNSLASPDVSVTQSQDHNEAVQLIAQFTKQIADNALVIRQLKTENKDQEEKLSNLNSQMNLEAIAEEKLNKIKELSDKLNELTEMNRIKEKVVQEYERTIATLLTESEQDKKRQAEERIKLINERDESRSHLATLEVSFNDIHSKYEKCKQVIFEFKANEDVLRNSVKDMEDKCAKMLTNYDTLKQHANAKLNLANEELDKMKKSHEAEILRLTVMCKRKEVLITSLEDTLLEKTKTNEELAAICDSLLAKIS